MFSELIIIALIALIGTLSAPVVTAWANYYFEEKKKRTNRKSPRSKQVA